MSHDVQPPAEATVSARIVGYLGPLRSTDWALLRAGSGERGRTVSAGEGWGLSVLHDHRIESVGGRRESARAVVWGRHVVDRRAPHDPADAAHELGLAGVWCDGPTVTVHTDVLALNDVYVRRIGNTEFFSDRIEPLTWIGRPLTPDIGAWASSLSFYGFVGAATPFSEIRRLDFGESLVLDETVTRRRDLPRWLTEPTVDATERDVVDALRAAVPGRWGPRSELPLSGGWDSRMIALAMATNGARRPRAWTIDPDTGVSDDVDIATELARALRLKHTIVPIPEDYGADRRELLDRAEYQTWLHSWLTPLARRVRGGGTVFDGLAGDVMIKDRTGNRIRSQTRGRQRRAIFAAAVNVDRMRSPLLDPELARAGHDVVRGEIDRLTDFWEGHPSRWKLSRFFLRTNRVIAVSPLRLFAPEATVVLPFVDPQVMKVLLAVPLRLRRGDDLARSVLTALDPDLGTMRSTNDLVGGSPVIAGPRRQERPDVLLDLARRVTGGDGQGRGVLAGPTLDLLHGDAQGLAHHGQLLHWAAAFADWRTAHAHRLESSLLPVH